MPRIYEREIRHFCRRVCLSEGGDTVRFHAPANEPPPEGYQGCFLQAGWSHRLSIFAVPPTPDWKIHTGTVGKIVLEVGEKPMWEMPISASMLEYQRYASGARLFMPTTKVPNRTLCRLLRFDGFEPVIFDVYVIATREES